MSDKLSEFFEKKALEDLGETVSRREQSIRQFREWLSKHPFIKFRDIEDDLILKFLRARKFSMPKVYESFEEVLHFFKSIELLVSFTPEKEAQLVAIFENGPYCVIPNRDSTGARLVFTRSKVMEEMQLTSDEIIQLVFICNFMMEREPEHQITGMRCINECRGVSLNFFNQLPFTFAFKWSGMSRHFITKVKSSYFIGLPSFAVAVHSASKALLKKKHQDRSHLIKDESELLKDFDPSMILKEYGGTVKVEECIEAQKPAFIETIKYVKNLISRIEFDMRKFKESRIRESGEAVGNFRKLEID